VLAEKDGKVSGSARSVKGFNIHDALAACADLLEQFGGHMYAAGLTMKPQNVEAFRARFEEVVRGTLDPALRTPEEEVDLEIGLAEINPPFVRAIFGMEPCGPLSMRPVFLSRAVPALSVQRIGADGTHLRFNVRTPGLPGGETKAIAFGFADFFDLVAGGQ